MKTGTKLATTLFAVASFPLLAQQSPANGQPDRTAPQQNPASSEPANPPASTAEMSQLNGELVSKLDSKTAKTGDSVVVQTKVSAKTADGTEIPKGSKLVGHVIGAQPGGAGQNSQVALVFDHLELKGGQSVPVHSQIQSISPAGGAASANESAGMSGPPATGSANPNASGANNSNGAGSAPQSAGGYAGSGAATSSGPAAGTVVAKTGLIAISTTSIPGVLLANNAPGQQDPRMAQASSILLGAKQDIQLDSGTQLVVGVSKGGGAQ